MNRRSPSEAAARPSSAGPSERAPRPSSTPSPLRARLKEQVASAIAQAAEEVFAEHGLHGAHVNEIAKRAGVAVGTLYNHYEDRDAILTALLQLRRSELLEAIDAVQEKHRDGTVEDELVALTDAFFQFFGEHRRFFLILMQSESMPRFVPATPGACNAMAEVAARIERATKRGVKEGLLRKSSSELFPAMLLGMMRGVAMRNLHLGEGDGVRIADARVIVRTFLEGTRKKAGS